MTEPTRDEINRALAEWAGWTDVRTRVCPADCCRDTFGIPPGSKLYSEVELVPDYTASLDAQVSLWERAEIAAAYFEWAVVKRWIVRLERAGANAEFHADSIPEASARALYAVLEASR